MASIWWVVVAFFAGGMGGAVLVALLNVNGRNEDDLMPNAVETPEENLRLLA